LEEKWFRKWIDVFSISDSRFTIYGIADVQLFGGFRRQAV
jgi:hypothetical protein